MSERCLKPGAVLECIFMHRQHTACKVTAVLLHTAIMHGQHAKHSYCCPLNTAANRSRKQKKVSYPETETEREVETKAETEMECPSRVFKVSDLVGG